MADEREAKLPQWARDTLADLRRKLSVALAVSEEQRAQIDDYAARQPGRPAIIELEPYRSIDPSRRAASQVFPIQTHVRIKGRPDAGRADIDVRVTDEGFIELNSNTGQLLVLPSGGQNCVKVATATDYEMARARELQKWEQRISQAQSEAEATRRNARTANK